MLGDFGEVYVLDWGVAKVAGAAEEGGISGESDGIRTHAGALVGTPGYMAPEQARGARDEISPRTDVYALGAMLFELLALAPLHRGQTVAALLASAQAPAPAPSERAEGVPLELDRICLRATALDPSERFPSARALQEAIDAYLAGERDAERRRELARELVAKGREVLARANERGPEAETLRSEGMRALGHAVALDPGDEAALKAVSEIILAPAQSLPPEATRELSRIELEDRARAARRSALMYVAWLALIPCVALMGLESPLVLALITALTLLCIGYSAFMGSAPERASPPYMRVAIFLNFALVTLSFAAFGPFILTPGVAASSAASFGIALRANQPTRRLLLVSALASVFAPLALQLFGLIPRTVFFERGVIEIRPLLCAFPAELTPAALVLVTFSQILLPALMVSRAVDGLVAAERRSFARAWWLRSLLPRS